MCTEASASRPDKVALCKRARWLHSFSAPCFRRADFSWLPTHGVRLKSHLQIAVRQHGLSLVELIVFIVVVGVGLAGVLGVLNYANNASVNPMLLKQQVAIAESLLEEVSSKAFTWCDPDDANVSTATSAAGCATTVQGTGPTSGESRYSSTTPFDNVGDYNGFAMNSGIYNINNAAITALAGYKASIAVSLAGTALGLADNTAGLRIDVTVTAPDLSTITLTGYRSRHAPNTP